MSALLYVLVAVSAVSLATEAFLADREDPARQAFLAFCLSVAVSYVGFSLSLLYGLEGFRALYLFAGSISAPAALWTVDRAFPQEEGSSWSGRMRTVYVGTALVAPLATAAHLVLYDGIEQLRWPAVAAGLMTTYGFSVALSRLWTAQLSKHLRVDRTRMQYLFGVLLTAVVFTVLEGLGRQLGPVLEGDATSLSSRILLLQGPIPPFSTVFVGLGILFLYHSVVMSRLLDLTELFSRLVTVLVSSMALVAIDLFTFQWMDTFTRFPFHSTFQLFVASLLFLAAYEPLRTRIAWFANRLFDRRSAQLKSALEQLRRRLATVIDVEVLTEELVGALHTSGRVPVCSVYLWDDRLEAFRVAGSRGHGDHPPMQVVAANPFTDRFARGAPWYLRSGVRRRALHDPEQAEVLALMDAMHSDLTLPLMSGRTVMGWVNLRDEAWSEGYAAEEILLLQKVAASAGVVLSNIRGFEVIEEQKRLAALGAMSAGLAHEIRNPLAGVKGAAQFLQGVELDGEAQEMLQVVIDQTDRLNIVVSQFLDYARPFELARESVDPNSVIGQSLMVLRAQGLSDRIELREALGEGLPLVRIDRTRMSQVLLNLLQNALQAMPEGGTLQVTSRLGVVRRGERTVEIAVSDTGPGMNAEVREKLFVPFFTTKHDGTGLGLPICRRIVEAHGGELEVHSAPDRGSTFVVRIAADDLAEAAA